MVTVALGVLLGAAGIAAIAVASLLLLGPLRQPLLVAIERARLQRCLSRCKRGDARLAADDVPGALREFVAAFCFVVPQADSGLRAEIARLHVGLLSRFMSIADDLPGERIGLITLAKVERLLDQWTENQRRMGRGTATARDTAELRDKRRVTQQAIRELANELLARRRTKTLVH